MIDAFERNNANYSATIVWYKIPLKPSKGRDYIGNFGIYSFKRYRLYGAIFVKVQLTAKETKAEIQSKLDEVKSNVKK